MTKQASTDLMRAWARIVRVKQTLQAAIELDLKEAGTLPLEWYDALLELERAPGGHLSPRELERQMLIAQYNLSRLVDRLEQKKLVKRIDYPGDKRRQLIEITELGKKQRKEAWPVYAAAVEKQAGGKFKPQELRQLLDLLGRIMPPA